MLGFDSEAFDVLAEQIKSFEESIDEFDDTIWGSNSYFDVAISAKTGMIFRAKISVSEDEENAASAAFT